MSDLKVALYFGNPLKNPIMMNFPATPDAWPMLAFSAVIISIDSDMTSLMVKDLVHPKVKQQIFPKVSGKVR